MASIEELMNKKLWRQVAASIQSKPDAEKLFANLRSKCKLDDIFQLANTCIDNEYYRLLALLLITFPQIHRKYWKNLWDKVVENTDTKAALTLYSHHVRVPEFPLPKEKEHFGDTLRGIYTATQHGLPARCTVCADSGVYAHLDNSHQSAQRPRS